MAQRPPRKYAPEYNLKNVRLKNFLKTKTAEKSVIISDVTYILKFMKYTIKKN